MTEETLPEIRIPPSRPVDSFTETELLAAELLVQLSESSGGDSSSSFSSSSPLSVNARPPPMAMMAEDDDDVEGQEEEDEIGGAPRRRRPRYRFIAELYAVTAPIDGVEKRNRGERQRGQNGMKGGK